MAERLLKWPSFLADKKRTMRFNLPPAVTDLMVALDEEVKLLEQFRSVVLGVREAVVGSDLGGLCTIIDMENALADQAAEMARTRAGKLAEVAPHFAGALDETASLADLADRLPGPVAGTCRHLCEKLSTLAREIAAANRANQSLLRKALSLVTDRLDVLRGTPGSSYRSSGRAIAKSAEAPAVLDRTG